MKNAFETLGLPPCLAIDTEALKAAFRETGKTAHPDAGGGDDEFAALREAFEILASPSRRLRHWLELRGIPGETRGPVDPRLMDLFAGIGAVIQRAESLIHRRIGTKSALGLALLENETQVCRESVEKTIQLVEKAIAGECSVFPDLQAADAPDADAPDADAASKTARNLAFLEKWRSALRSVFSRLV